MKIKWWLRLVRLAVLAAAGLLVLVLLPRWSGLRRQDLLDYTPARPLLAALAVIALHCLKSVLMVIPMMALYLCSGFLFEPGWALLVTYTGLLCELSLGYLLGRRAGRDGVSELLGKNRGTARLLRLDRSSGPVAVVAARLSPLNYDLVSMLFGSLNMPFARYMGFSLLGLSPTTVPYVLAGGALDDIWSARFLVPFGLCLAAALLVLWLHWWRGGRHPAPAAE